MGAPWLSPDEREAVRERFGEALKSTFGAESGVAMPQDRWERALRKYPQSLLPENADPLDREVGDLWRAAWDRARLDAFRLLQNRDRDDAVFQIEFVPDSEAR